MIAQTIKLEVASTIQISHVLLASLKYPISSTFLGFSTSYGAEDISEFVEFVLGVLLFMFFESATCKIGAD